MDLPDRQSIRLNGYDYSQNGWYFVTICTKDRWELFGKIHHGHINLSEIGRITEHCWKQIPTHFPYVSLGAFVVMPNHVHGIIKINNPVGANNHSPANKHININPSHNLSSTNLDISENDFFDFNRANNHSPLQNPLGTSKTVGSIVRGFKIGVTKWFRENMKLKNLWQRNFYEHVIRDEIELYSITNYIESNIENWDSK